MPVGSDYLLLNSIGGSTDSFETGERHLAVPTAGSAFAQAFSGEARSPEVDLC